ncbi:MAG: sugar isomerase domain-containing protein [Chloroflexi bacterium]|nr:sugar isomerase domain-containing protein [Chloroflexota bacterium]
MLIDRYFDAVQALLESIRKDSEPIKQAAEICADAMTRGGVVHIFDSGHMVSRELINRAGGLVALTPLTFSLNVDNPVKTRESRPADPCLSYHFIEHIFQTDQLREGDVLIIGSVSGKSANVVELAQQARAHGLTVIALTAPAYSSRLDSQHPSGKRLYESADLVLDNHAPYGDAMLEVDGLDYPVLPASGLGAAITLWAMTAEIIDVLTRRGLKPTVYPSVNRPDGPEMVKRVENEAREKGY